MATGDVLVFDTAVKYLLDGGWEPTDNIRVAICDNTTTPADTNTNPSLGAYTEVGAAGSYVAGGASIGTLTSLCSQSAGDLTFDSGTNPSWAQNASNDTDAWWGIIYNDDDANNLCIAFVELGGPVDMAAGSLTITWNANGIFTINK